MSCMDIFLIALLAASMEFIGVSPPRGVIWLLRAVIFDGSTVNTPRDSEKMCMYVLLSSWPVRKEGWVWTPWASDWREGLPLSAGER